MKRCDFDFRFISFASTPCRHRVNAPPRAKVRNHRDRGAAWKGLRRFNIISRPVELLSNDSGRERFALPLCCSVFGLYLPLFAPNYRANIGSRSLRAREV